MSEQANRKSTAAYTMVEPSTPKPTYATTYVTQPPTLTQPTLPPG